MIEPKDKHDAVLAAARAAGLKPAVIESDQYLSEQQADALLGAAAALVLRAVDNDGDRVQSALARISEALETAYPHLFQTRSSGPGFQA